MEILIWTCLTRYRRGWQLSKTTVIVHPRWMQLKPVCISAWGASGGGGCGGMGKCHGKRRMPFVQCYSRTKSCPPAPALEFASAEHMMRQIADQPPYHRLQA